MSAPVTGACYHHVNIYGKGLAMETETVEQVGFTATRVCVECDRAFNLFDADDANEWFYGHDCEAA